MASKQQIFKKITELLQDINEQYQAQAFEGKAAEDILRADLFEATVNYFAAHVSIYNRLLKKEMEQSDALESPLNTGAVEHHTESNEREGQTGRGETEPVINSEADAREETTQEEANPREEISFTPETESVYNISDDPEVQGEEQPKQEEAQEEIAEKAGERSATGETKSETSEPEAPQQVIPEAATPESETRQWEADDRAKEALPADDHRGNPTDENNALPADEFPVAEVGREADNRNDTDRTEAPTETVNEVTIEEKAFPAGTDDLPNTREEKPSRPLSINEIMSAQRKTGGNPLFSAKRGDKERVTDLKSAISLNDKLLFIKDLFNGYSLAYSEAIELLNRYDDFASADAFLQANYAQKNNWADKQATVDKLYAIMRKRFGH